MMGVMGSAKDGGPGRMQIGSWRKRIMPARTTRQEARARILAAFSAPVEGMIPEDESVPLKGARFADFEDQAEALAQTASPGTWKRSMVEIFRPRQPKGPDTRYARPTPPRHASTLPDGIALVPEIDARSVSQSTSRLDRDESNGWIGDAT